jgi:hypothetical protein
MEPLEEPELKLSDIDRITEPSTVYSDAGHKTENDFGHEGHSSPLKNQLLTFRHQNSCLSYIPDELMVEIFKWVTVFDSLNIGPIFWVCRKWYQLAVNSPSLWATISLDFYDTHTATTIKHRTQYAEAAI